MPRRDTSEQGEESLAEHLDALQDQILANDNHLFATNAKIEASQA
jgi:hypothetical protein